MPDMRFAPPPSLRIAAQTTGLNSVAVRSTNERIILSHLVQHRALSRLELGQKSGLSAQTISVISRALQRDGLIVAGEAQRGRVGPPTIPVVLNPDGAFGLGVSLGPHGIDTVLAGLTGATAGADHMPRPADADPLDGLALAVRTALDRLDARKRARLAGIGVALPSDLGPWADVLSDGARLETRLEAETGLPIFIQNGVTAATGAESIFGAARGLSEFLYAHVGPTTEFRLVLQHRVYAGEAAGTPGLDSLATQADEGGMMRWDRIGDTDLERWLARVVDAIAVRIAALSAFVRIPDVLVAGPLPSSVRNRVIDGLAAALSDHAVAAGAIADDSIATGAATLPITARYLQHS